MEKKGTLRQKRRPKGDPNPQKGPQGDPGPLKGTQLGTVLLARVLAGILTGFESAQPTKHKSPGLRQANKKEEPKPKTLYRYLLEVLQY